MFRDYAEHGWVLVPLREGEKAPAEKGWSQRDNCIQNPLVAHRLKAAGLAHAYSGTCALDIDDLEAAREGLAEWGVDIDLLLSAPDAVRIDSGSKNSAKLLYALDEPLPTKALVLTEEKRHAAQMRCGTADGKTVQDALPPSLHPSGRRYRWAGAGEWDELPPIPSTLLAAWKEAIGSVAGQSKAGEPKAQQQELERLLPQYDPDSNYTDWIKVGMALHHESGGAAWGFALWDDWSSTGKKYKGKADLIAHWRSFGNSESPVTVGSLRSSTVATADDFRDLGDAQDEEEFDPWEARRGNFTLVHASEWANRPPPTWLIKDILPYQDLAMMYGAPGSGKSFLALDMALAIAGFEDWRGEYKTDHGTVVWLAAEAAGSMRNRIQAYMQGKDIDMSMRNLWIVGETPNLSDAVNVSALTEAVKAAEPLLIVVDTLSAASGGANENSGEDMNAVLTACRLLHEETGALVLLIHHSGKDSSRGARGWSGLQGAVHTELEVIHLPDTQARMAKITKQRDAEGGVQLPFQLVPVQISMEDTSCIVDHFETAKLAVMTQYSEPLDMPVDEPHFLMQLMSYEVDGDGPELDTAEFSDLL